MATNELMGYTWTVESTEHEPVASLKLWTPDTQTVGEGVRKLRWNVLVEYSRYQLSVVRTTWPALRRNPRLVESITLADRSKDSLLQPKDWGGRRVDLFRAGAVETTKPAFDWKDIKHLRPFFIDLHPKVQGCVGEGNILPLVDWLTEQSENLPFATFFSTSGGLPL